MAALFQENCLEKHHPDPPKTTSLQATVTIILDTLTV